MVKWEGVLIFVLSNVDTVCTVNRIKYSFHELNRSGADVCFFHRPKLFSIRNKIRGLSSFGEFAADLGNE
jgi:hypothetical protein